ncbi:ATP-binding domain-containing protein [Rhizorhabdus sp. FW153]
MMALDEQRQEQIKILSADILQILKRIAEEAREQLRKRNAISADKLAQGNTLNTPATIDSFNRIAREVAESNARLAEEPAIARVVAVDDEDNEAIYFISRGASSMKSEGRQHYCSHYAPAGGLASIPPGETLDLRKGDRVVTLEVIERTLLHPSETGDGWDSFDTEFQADQLGTITIQSLLRLLTEALPEDDPLAAIEKLIAAAEAGDNVIEGRVRNIIRKAELRDQAVLDRYQSEIFRLPIDSQLVILGSPGTGKTTTLIRRLGQKLNYVELPEEEKATIDTAASVVPHGSSWIMFTPTDLLRSYLKEAFSRENVPASDNVVRTWTVHRRDLAGNSFSLLRTSGGSGGRFIARENAGTLLPDAADQIAWFEDFNTWQTEAFWADLSTAADLLAEASANDVSSIGGRLKAILGRTATTDTPSTIIALVSFNAEIRILIEQLNSEIDEAYKRALTAQMRTDPQFFAKLTEFMNGLADVGDQIDDADDDDGDEDEEEPARAVTGPAAARKAFNDALRRQARQHVTRRRPGRSVAAQVLEWLGDRGFAEGERETVGRTLLLLQALRRFSNPVRALVRGVATRYARFRRIRRSENRWYTEAGAGRLADDFEIDIILLAILRAANGLLADARISRAADQPAYAALASMLGAQRNQILVDEATDFSPVQLGCMRALASYRTNSFFACGDFDQRITPWGSKRRSDLEWVSPGIEIRPVSISYRQSRQLFDFARALAALFENHGEVELPPEMNNDAVDPILLLDTPDLDDVAAWLFARIAEIEGAMKGEPLPTVAVLVHEEAAVRPMTDALNRAFTDTNLRAIACVDGRIIGNDDEIRVFDVKHIKGLEFEAVFFVAIDALADAKPDLFDKYLYVGATRAATYLGITCNRHLPSRLEVLRGLLSTDWKPI